jgi:hypothetical protein
MFVANFRIKTAVQRWLMAGWDFLEYPRFHPAHALREEALRETVCYIKDHMVDAMGVESAREVLLAGLRQIEVEGAYLEFGVFRGGTIRFIADRVRPKLIHGFDSFEGLPSSWTGDSFNFDARGRLPRVPKNVQLHRGWFTDTLPKWVEDHSGPVAFLHVDSDLYESAACVFDHLGDRIVPGTVVVFDEYFNYPQWRQHEFRAWKEFIDRCKIGYEYLAYARQQVAVVVTDTPWHARR